MPESAIMELPSATVQGSSGHCRVAVIWIDWYAYHVARFAGILSAAGLKGHAVGIELVGGVGVHTGLKFRENLPQGLPIETLMPDASWREAGQLRLARKLWRCLSRLQPEVVLVPGYYTLPALAAAVWAKLHRSTSVLMTESTAADHERVWWKERAKALLIRSLFDWAVAGGEAHVRYLRLLGFPGDRIALRYDVVDNDFFSAAARKLRTQPAAAFSLPERYFLYVGRLAPEKNVRGLIRSWIDYRRNGGTWPLVLVGDGSDAEELRRLAAASSWPDEIRFAGHRGSSELPPYYAFASCFVLPSTREPWGLVVNEAMASGLPVLVSSRCGCAEDLVVDGWNGFAFDPDLPEELARLMNRMEEMEPSDRQNMGCRSADSIRQYSPKALGKEIDGIYSSRRIQLSKSSLPVTKL